jgi:hypothetical protein
MPFNNASHHTQCTRYFYVETQMEENHEILFNIYIFNITSTGSTNFQDSLGPIGRRHRRPVYRLQHEGSYNSLDSLAPTGRSIQTEGSYNYLNSPTTIGRRLQPSSLQAST